MGGRLRPPPSSAAFGRSPSNGRRPHTPTIIATGAGRVRLSLKEPAQARAWGSPSLIDSIDAVANNPLARCLAWRLVAIAETVLLLPFHQAGCCRILDAGVVAAAPGRLPVWRFVECPAEGPSEGIVAAGGLAERPARGLNDTTERETGDVRDQVVAAWWQSSRRGHQFRGPPTGGLRGKAAAVGQPAADVDRCRWGGQDPARAAGGGRGAAGVRRRGVAGRAGRTAGPHAAGADGRGHHGAAGPVRPVAAGGRGGLPAGQAAAAGAGQL
jgi:hypothetical protein